VISTAAARAQQEAVGSADGNGNPVEAERPGTTADGANMFTIHHGKVAKIVPYFASSLFWPD
jgi:hypothetical protein